jgi:hypothetical protein
MRPLPLDPPRSRCARLPTPPNTCTRSELTSRLFYGSFSNFIEKIYENLTVERAPRSKLDFAFELGDDYIIYL